VSPMKACVVCARPVPAGMGSRCELHPKRPVSRDRRYRHACALIKANAERCGICGEGPRPDDPWVVDHITPRARGGSDEPSNLQAAHRSCNGRKGQAIGEEWSA
jgi:5-methylcytosine-specific restriction endonuclease McrA